MPRMLAIARHLKGLAVRNPAHMPTCNFVTMLCRWTARPLSGAAVLLSAMRLTAQEPHYKNMGRRFQRSHQNMDNEQLVWALAFIVVVILLAVAGFFLGRALRRAALQSPHRLFRQLCRAHKLSRKERSLLRHVAAHHKLDSPAAVFLDPTLLSAEIPGGHRETIARVASRIYS